MAAVAADEGLLDLEAPGDVVLAAGSGLPTLAEELQAVLIGQFGLAVGLEYRTDAQNVVVARGAYDFRTRRSQWTSGAQLSRPTE